MSAADGSKCFRCWNEPLRAPVVARAEDVFGWSTRKLNEGCLHDMALEVSFSEYTALVKSERERLLFWNPALTIGGPDLPPLVFPLYGYTVSVACRKPPFPFPFRVLDRDGERVLDVP